MLYRCWLCVVLLLPFVISSRNSLHAALCCFSHQPGLSALPSVTAAPPAPAISIQPQVLSLLAAATCRWCGRRVLLTTAIHTVACSSPVSAGGALYLHTSRRSVVGATGLTASRRSAVGATGLQHHAGQRWGLHRATHLGQLGQVVSYTSASCIGKRGGGRGGGGSLKDEITIFKNYDKTVG